MTVTGGERGNSMVRAFRATLVAVALVATAVFVAPQSASAACDVNVGTPYHYGHTIYGGGNVNGCNQGPYKIKLGRVYAWGTNGDAYSPEFNDGGGAVAAFNCDPGSVHTYRVVVLKRYFTGFTEWVEGPEVRITC